jgi:precorrin-2 methylase
MSRGSLTIVGTGISVGQITMETRGYLASAEKVLYCVADAATERLILKLNSTSESIYGFYGEDKHRIETYEEMVARTMECVREGLDVCVAYYGHPGIFVYPSHKAIKIAQDEGYSARMIPAVSCIDCLFCDLGVDPAMGCQIFEATDLMVRKRAIDTNSHIIIMQVGALGDLAFSFKGYGARKLHKHLPTLGEYLAGYYPLEFGLKIYNASQFSICAAEIIDITVKELVNGSVKKIATLYIPPIDRPAIHLEMLDRYEMRHILDGWRLMPLNSRPSDGAKEFTLDEKE